MPALIPSVKVVLDRERSLYFDINANIAFEEEVGKSLIETMQDIAVEMKAAQEEGRPPKMPATRMIRALLWAGVRSETLDAYGNETADTLSLHDVGALLDFGTMMQKLQQIGEAFSKGMEGLPSAESNPRKAPRQNSSHSTGRGSGVSRMSSVLAKGTS